MKASIFNLRVPLPERNEVFLMNTLTDAQIVVSPDVAALLDRAPALARAASLKGGAPRPPGAVPMTDAECDAVDALVENGFLVESREADRRAIDKYFHDIREDASQLRVTVLTTLQCNFACDYCYQGDHGDYNKFAHKMSLETAEQVGDWIERRLDATGASTFVLTFFGGEPLLNLPVVYRLSERLWHATRARGARMLVNIITNGLLLTPEIVDQLRPFGLNGIKVTLDGDQITHDRMRPLRGGQGTFERIVENVRRVSDKVSIAIGGNFDESSVDSFPALLDFLKEQEFADKLSKVAFKPIVRQAPAPGSKGMLALTPVGTDGKPLNGTCMTSVGAGGSPCDTCHFIEEKSAELRQETKKRGFPTPDGVHMGPCEIHRRNAHTIGPDGALYACPGFTGEQTKSVGHIDGRHEEWRAREAERFERLAAWQSCGDCAFIPVCAGGCSVASHIELGDMETPTCHKSSFETALVALANEVAAQV
jgi:uncharacterized protein